MSKIIVNKDLEELAKKIYVGIIPGISDQTLMSDFEGICKNIANDSFTAAHVFYQTKIAIEREAGK